VVEYKVDVYEVAKLPNRYCNKQQTSVLTSIQAPSTTCYVRTLKPTDTENNNEPTGEWENYITRVFTTWSFEQELPELSSL
jgi:hypothetical protein